MKRLLVLLLFAAASWGVESGGELRLALRNEPKTYDPLLVSEENGQVVRYLTGGVLVRLNRQTQVAEPELAESWKAVSGRRIEFRLRPGLKFSDGSALTENDVLATLRRLMDPSLQGPTPDSFRNAFGQCRFERLGPGRLAINTQKTVVNPEKNFDEITILPATPKPGVGAGPFVLEDRKPGAYIRLVRNPHYWKRDEAGRPLPYLAAIRLEIVQNRDVEYLRYGRGELHLINSIDAELYDRLRKQSPGQAKDGGPSLDFEKMWFNQSSRSPIAAHKKAWFQSVEFRRAVSMAIRKQDLARIVFRGLAHPANGPVSPANRRWRREETGPAGSPEAARQLLAKAGFVPRGGALRDAAGNPVEFTVVTNAGNKTRERMAALIQQDLAAIGIKVSIAALDFPSLVERIMKTLDYEACLIGMVNVELDPSSQVNTLLSSSSMHPWNPGQKSPETPWEAEIDRSLQVVSGNPDFKARKAAFDRVQEIIVEQVPIIYLVHKHVLTAVSPEVKNAAPAILFPQAFWNAERLWLEKGQRASR